MWWWVFSEHRPRGCSRCARIKGGSRLCPGFTAWKLNLSLARQGLAVAGPDLPSYISAIWAIPDAYLLCTIVPLHLNDFPPPFHFSFLSRPHRSCTGPPVEKLAPNAHVTHSIDRPKPPPCVGEGRRRSTLGGLRRDGSTETLSFNFTHSPPSAGSFLGPLAPLPARGQG